MAISAGPSFKFNPSVSFQIKCSSTEEVDAIWEQLSPGGKVLVPIGAYPFSARYGWLEDRYALSWHVMHVDASLSGQKITPVLMFVGDSVRPGGRSSQVLLICVRRRAGSRDRRYKSRRSCALRQGPGTGSGGDCALRAILAFRRGIWSHGFCARVQIHVQRSDIVHHPM
jgi:hypothetical protein